MRVLVVEDVHRLAHDIAEGLRDHGMAVDVSYDGIDAAAKLNVNRYDVVLLYRDLPGIPGDALCRMIADSDDPAMILMLTAAGTTPDRVSGLSLGVVVVEVAEGVEMASGRVGYEELGGLGALTCV